MQPTKYSRNKAGIVPTVKPTPRPISRGEEVQFLHDEDVSDQPKLCQSSREEPDGELDQEEVSGLEPLVVCVSIRYGWQMAVEGSSVVGLPRHG